MRAQPRLHMRQRNPLIIRRQRPAQNCCRISLHKHYFRPHFRQHGLQACERPRRDFRQRLPLLHKVQVHIRLHVEHGHHLIQQAPVLGRHNHARGHAPSLQLLIHWRQLDGFWTRPEN